MATVNFSVPDEIRDRFNKTFAGRNKSAILSRLMEQAVEEEERRLRRARAIEEILALRTKTRPASDAEIRKARESGRP